MIRFLFSEKISYSFLSFCCLSFLFSYKNNFFYYFWFLLILYTRAHVFGCLIRCKAEAGLKWISEPHDMSSVRCEFLPFFTFFTYTTCLTLLFSMLNKKPCESVSFVSPRNNTGRNAHFLSSLPWIWGENSHFLNPKWKNFSQFSIFCCKSFQH